MLAGSQSGNMDGSTKEKLRFLARTKWCAQTCAQNLMHMPERGKYYVPGTSKILPPPS